MCLCLDVIGAYIEWIDIGLIANDRFIRWEQSFGSVWSQSVISPLSFSVNFYILTSVCIFSILFSIHFLRCGQGEFVNVLKLRASLVRDYFLSLFLWLKCLILGWWFNKELTPTDMVVMYSNKGGVHRKVRSILLLFVTAVVTSMQDFLQGAFCVTLGQLVVCSVLGWVT